MRPNFHISIETQKRSDLANGLPISIHMVTGLTKNENYQHYSAFKYIKFQTSIATASTLQHPLQGNLKQHRQDASPLAASRLVCIALHLLVHAAITIFAAPISK